MSENDLESAREEGRHHHYVGSTIPWQVHLLWVAFWIGTLWYLVRYLLPTMHLELLSPP